MAEFGADITPGLNALVVALDRELSASPPPGMVELVPTYRSLMVVFDPLITGFTAVRRAVAAAAARCEAAAATRTGTGPGRRWTVPVCYGSDPGGQCLGEDLAHVAAHAGMSEGKIVGLHARAEYRVYMIGFAPGFAYLGGLPERLHIPRRGVPKPRVDAGSIMIGGMQTAIASVAIPTGWHVIGRTPARAFDMARAGGEFLFRAGDIVRFEAVGRAEFDSLEDRARRGDPVARMSA